MHNLSSQAHELELHQFIRIINQGSFSQHHLCFQPANSLAFPATQIKTMKQEPGREVVELTCLSLYGVSSPLPHYFITDALNDDNVAFREFLSLFNQQIYKAYFYAWEHKHPELFQTRANTAHALICDLTSEGIKASEPRPGLATQFVYQNRTLQGLKCLIACLYPELPYEIDIKNCEWVPVHQPSRLGVCQLGDNLTLGRRIVCASHKIIVTFGPVRLHHREYFDLTQWIKQYLKLSMNLEIIWQIEAQDARSRLSQGMQLGWSASLGLRKTSMIKVTHV